MNEKYYNDYPKEPIGGTNPYMRCSSCGRSEPEIDGKLDGHYSDCEWALKHRPRKTKIITREYWFDIDGVKVPNEEAMLSKLLDDNTLFCNSRKYVDLDGKTIMEETIVIFLNCNDVFAGCADAESITLKELPELFKLIEDNEECGVIQWVCIKRNQYPQQRMIDYLKKHNGYELLKKNIKTCLS